MRIILCISVLCLISCGDTDVVALSEDLSDGWSYEQSVTLSYDQPTDLFVVHDDSYKYQNLYITLRAEDWVDTVSIRLADQKGYWKGEPSKGTYRLLHSISRPYTTIVVEQYSRDSILTGIRHVGLVKK